MTRFLSRDGGASVLGPLFFAVALVAGCGDDAPSSESAGDAGIDSAARHDGGQGAQDGSTPGSDSSVGDDDDGASPPADSGSEAGNGDDAGDLIGQLNALTANCTVASGAKYATDQGEASTIDICKLTGAFFWKADMDVDCDGQTTTECNGTTDPSYQSDTSFHQSNNKPLIASTLPYVVIPLASNRFDYAQSNIKPGAVVLVLYGGKMTYGVFGDEGPKEIIGESSYAMAKSLGIDPNPASGGVDKGVTYIAFTGDTAVVDPIEDHQAAITLGGQLVSDLIKNN